METDSNNKNTDKEDENLMKNNNENHKNNNEENERQNSFAKTNECTKPNTGDKGENMIANDGVQNVTDNDGGQKMSKNDVVLNVTGNDGGENMTTNGGENMTTTDGGENMTTTDGGVNMTTTDGSVNMTITDGGVNKTTTDGGINMTTTDGSVNMTITDGGVNKTTTDGGINMTTTDGGINMTTTDGVLNVTGNDKDNSVSGTVIEGTKNMSGNGDQNDPIKNEDKNMLKHEEMKNVIPEVEQDSKNLITSNSNENDNSVTTASSNNPEYIKICESETLSNGQQDDSSETVATTVTETGHHGDKTEEEKEAFKDDLKKSGKDDSDLFQSNDRANLVTNKPTVSEPLSVEMMETDTSLIPADKMAETESEAGVCLTESKSNCEEHTEKEVVCFSDCEDKAEKNKVSHSMKYRDGLNSSSDASGNESDTSEVEDDDARKKETAKSPKIAPFCMEDLRTRGEIFPEELPAIGELTISVTEDVQLVPVGIVTSSVRVLVVIEHNQELPPLDEDTILFTENRKPFGQIFEVFGPVASPFYSVRFNSAEEIKEKGIKEGDIVYCAPKVEEFTHYVFVERLKRIKGSDASWENNNEPPDSCKEFSDDEDEKRASRSRKHSGEEPMEDPTDCLPGAYKPAKRKQTRKDVAHGSKGTKVPGKKHDSHRPLTCWPPPSPGSHGYRAPPPQSFSPFGPQNSFSPKPFVSKNTNSQQHAASHTRFPRHKETGRAGMHQQQQQQRDNFSSINEPNGHSEFQPQQHQHYRPPHQHEFPKNFETDQRYPRSGIHQQPSSPFRTNQEQIRPFGMHQKPPVPFGMNQESMRPYGANLESRRPFGMNQEPTRPFGMNQEPTRPFGMNQEPTRPFGTNQEPMRPFGMNQEATRPFGINQQQQYHSPSTDQNNQSGFYSSGDSTSQSHQWTHCSGGPGPRPPSNSNQPFRPNIVDSRFIQNCNGQSSFGGQPRFQAGPFKQPFRPGMSSPDQFHSGRPPYIRPNN